MKKVMLMLVAMFAMGLLSPLAFASVVTIPSDYGTVGGETLLFDPLDGTGTATLAGGANWTTGSGGRYGEGLEINQNKNERAFWNKSDISTSQINEGTIELYWKVPSAGVSWFSTFPNMFIEDSATFLQIFMPNNSPTLNFALFKSGPGYATVSSTNTTWTPDTWYHLAFTWSASGMEIWVDGALDNSITDVRSWSIQNSTTVSLGSQSNARVPPVGIYDSFRVSNTANSYVPEPATVSLLVMGATVWLRKRKRSV